jgi:poly-gamma-glutamate synthase PgsB/CapB
VTISPFKALLIPALCLAFFLLYLFLERVALQKRLKKIPLRICVNGTRGKSTVTRLIASVLAEAGYRVLAKTTGSKPVLIFPDKTEKEIKRAGKPTILEQKQVLSVACEVHADALVVEMMSIRPENSRVESEKLLRPQVLVMTNVRLDHVDDMGRTKPEIAASLAEAIPSRGPLLVMEEELYPVFQAASDKKETRIIEVARSAGREIGGQEFEENVRLTLAVAGFFGISKDMAFRGMAKAQPDFGGLKVWTTMSEGKAAAWYLASAFAANEPESTQKVLSLLRERFPQLPSRMIALLNLREDRGDRTRQWLEALKTGFFDAFEHLVFIGDHARALGRKKLSGPLAKTKISASAERCPQKIMDEIFGREIGGAVIIGMGNMAGLGGELVNHWAQIGVSL